MTPNKIELLRALFVGLPLNPEVEWSERLAWFVGLKAIDDFFSGDRWSPDQIATIRSRV